MKKTIYIVFAVMLSFIANSSKAQTTAMNYNFIDCAGNSQSIFADLDAGKAVILEFFMNSCSPCITAGGKLESMKADLLAEYPGMVKAYAFGYNNTYTCTTINNWVSTNSFTSIPADSGAAQVAYYGGMGMPTIVILGGGTAHSVLGSPYVGFTTSDTTTMAADIRNFLGATASVNENEVFSQIALFPNPSTTETNLSFNITKSTNVVIEIIDVTGRRVESVMSGNVSAGAFNKAINISNLAEGLYYISIKADGIVSQKPLNVIR
ncbi:MAG TPA: T9SS type A sorting domain-containing protein [Bacteroidia bacterium]|jgi:hypothetical protein